MTDDLDDLKSLMNDATPAPNAQRRAENIALAQKNFKNLQGSRIAARPTFRKQIWTGAKTMLNTLTSRGGLTATTAIVGLRLYDHNALWPRSVAHAADDFRTHRCGA